MTINYKLLQKTKDNAFNNMLDTRKAYRDADFEYTSLNLMDESRPIAQLTGNEFVTKIRELVSQVYVSTGRSPYSIINAARGKIMSGSLKDVVEQVLYRHKTRIIEYFAEGKPLKGEEENFMLVKCFYVATLKNYLREIEAGTRMGL